MRLKHSLMTLTLGAGALLLSAGTVWSAEYGTPPNGQQQGAQPQNMPPNANQAPKIGQQTVQKFKQAYDKVGAIAKEYSPKIQATHDRSKAQSLQKEAQGKMINAVKGSGLSVTKYNQIAAMMQSNPSLRQQIMRDKGSS